MSKLESVPDSLFPASSEAPCKFCQILRKEIESSIVYEDATCCAFLDHRPLFPGHTLLVPQVHCETLRVFPAELIPAFFADVQMLAGAVEEALGAEGTFVAINNKVSQSVPHLHVHIVPRRRGDGMKGFFWPRHPYRNAAEMLATQKAIRSAIRRLQTPGPQP
jgi:histidine triad (HIT) family protein